MTHATSPRPRSAHAHPLKKPEQVHPTPPSERVVERVAAQEQSAAPPIAAPAPVRATFLRSFVYAWRGLIYAVRTQRNARVHLVIALAAIGLGIVLHISAVEFAMVFVAITGVFIGEMFNTVAEACVDLTTQEYHPLARIAKDVAAGAVLLNAMLSVVIGIFVFGPHLWALALRILGR